MHNGDIVPCTSLRNQIYVEGNIRNTSLKDLWKNGFQQFREFSSNNLDGLCLDCMYSKICRGGCTNSRYCVQGKIDSENIYCMYNVAVKQMRSSIPDTKDFSEIEQVIFELQKEENYQVLIYYIHDLLEENRENQEHYLFLLKVLAYSYFQIELFQKSVSINKLILEISPYDLYALKGLGLATYCEGNTYDGKNFLYKCISRTDQTFMDPYQDLITILREEGNIEESNIILREAKKKNPNFIWKNQRRYLDL